MRILNKLGLIYKGSPIMDGWFHLKCLYKSNSNNINLIFYGEDGEIEYGGSTKNKDTPLFDVDYIINNYFEGDLKIIKDSRLTKEELFGII